MFSEKRIIGYWKEDKHYFKRQDFLMSLIELKSKEKNYSKEFVLSYLNSGELLTGVRGPGPDLLDNSKEIVGKGSCITDGYWIWTVDVPYYVENYDIGLPEEFVDHMAKNDYKIPKITEQEAYEMEISLLKLIRIN